MKSLFLNYFNYLIGAYVLVSFLIARSFYAHPIVSAVVVAPNLFLIPYLVGTSISYLFVKTLNSKRISFRFLIGFLVGIIFLHSLFVLAEFFGYKIEMSIFDTIIISIIMVGFARNIICQRGRLRKVVVQNYGGSDEEKVDTRFLACILVVFLIAVTAFYIPKIVVPFPAVSLDGGVGHEILKPVNRLLSDGVLDVYRTRGLPVVLEAIVCSLSNVPVLNLDWAAPLGTCLLFAFSMFSLSFSVSKRKIVALAAVLLAFFINTAGLSFDVTSYIFRYSTIMAAIFPLAVQEAYMLFIGVKKEIFSVRKHIMILLITTLTIIAILWTFDYLRPAFLVSFFEVNEFLRPFLYVGFLAFSLIYISTLKDQILKDLILVMALLTPFAISLDIFRPVISVLFLYFLVLLIDQIDFKNAVSSVRTFSVTDLRHWLFGRTKNSRIKLRTLWSVKMNILRVISILLVLWLLALISGYVRLEQIAPFYKEQTTSLSKSQSLIASDSIEVLILSLFLGVFLLFSSRVEDFAFAFSFIVGMFVYFLPIFEVYYIAHEFLNVFMAFTISIGTFRIISMINKYMRALKSEI